MCHKNVKSQPLLAPFSNEGCYEHHTKYSEKDTPKSLCLPDCSCWPSMSCQLFRDSSLFNTLFDQSALDGHSGSHSTTNLICYTKLSQINANRYKKKKA